MKYFLFILIFFITSCSPPEPGTEAWFKEQHKELKQYCDSKGILYMCTPFSKQAFPFYFSGRGWGRGYCLKAMSGSVV